MVKNFKASSETYFRLLVRPYDTKPLMIRVPMDFVVTGDVEMGQMTQTECTEIEMILDFVRNHVADYHLKLIEEENAARERLKDRLSGEGDSLPF